MDLGGFNWSIITIVGPLILAVILLWVLLRNRGGKADTETTERATHDAYDAEERARREEDGDG